MSDLPYLPFRYLVLVSKAYLAGVSSGQVVSELSCCPKVWGSIPARGKFSD